MALGYVPLYNHSYRSNCEYEMDFEGQVITIRSMRYIQAGEEVMINYNGDWNNETPVWFDVRGLSAREEKTREQAPFGETWAIFRSGSAVREDAGDIG